MPYSITKVDIWTGEMEDQVGGLTAKLEPLADAGADLEVVIARRQPDKPGKGVVFLGPVAGAKAVKAAEAAGLVRAQEMAALRVEGTNKPGECSRVTRLLADAGINLRGLAAAVAGNKFVMALGFDSDADATKASKLLQATRSKSK